MFKTALDKTKRCIRKIFREVKNFIKKKPKLFFIVISLFLIILLSFVIYSYLKPKPNDDIFFLPTNSNAVLGSKNPSFNVAFGKRDQPDTQWVRFEAKSSSKNPFEEKKENIFTKISGWAKPKKEYGIEMSLQGVNLSETEKLEVSDSSDVIKSVAEIIGTDDIKTSTELVEGGRVIGEYTEQPVSKKTVVNKNVANGVDIEYQVLEGLGLKEEIVIRSIEEYGKECKGNLFECKLPLNEFIFDLKLDEGLELKRGWFTLEGKSTENYYFEDSNGNYVAHFLPSWAVDNAGNKTYDVILNVEEGEGENYRVEVIVDINWLFSSERIFPVRIDPSIVHNTKVQFDNGFFERTESIDGPKIQLETNGGFSSGEYVSPIIDFTATSTISDFGWTESGVQTGNGEIPYSTTGLVAQWNFNETSGTTAISDGSCGSSCNGTLSNMTTTGQDAAVSTGWTNDYRKWGNGAVMFDGSDDAIALGNQEAYSLQTFSLESWFWLKDVSSQRTIFGTLNSSGYKGYVLKINSSGYLYFVTVNDAGGVIDSVTDTMLAEAGRWYHVVITVNQGGPIKMYVDGKFVVEDSSTSTILYDATHYPRIGIQYGTGNGFYGSIDTTRFYSRILTDSEVLSNYQAGNIEFQYRMSSDGTVWNSWSTSTNKVQITSMDSDSSEWKVSGKAASGVPLTLSNTYNTVSGPTGCTYKDPVLINNIHNNNRLSNYIVTLNVAYKTGMSSDFSDLRFTNSSGTDLDYFISSYTDSKTANILLEVDSIPSQSVGKVYMWYGSCTGGSASNAETTYLLYEDFDSFDSSKWTTSSTGTVSAISGYAYPSSFGTNNGSYHGPTITADLENIISETEGFIFDISVYWQVVSSGLATLKIALQNDNTVNNYIYYVDNHAATAESHEYLYDSVGNLYSACTADGAQCLTSGTWTSVRETRNESSNLTYSKNGTINYNNSANIPTINKLSISFGQYTTYAANTMRVDNIRLRKYSLPEPTAKVDTQNESIYMEGQGSLKAEIGSIQSDSNTIGYWKFDETAGSGAYLKDYSGSGNNGTPVGTAYSVGKVKGGRYFDGTDDYINLSTYASSVDVASITVSFWIKTTDDNGGYAVFLANADNSAFNGICLGNNCTSYCTNELITIATRRSGTDTNRVCYTTATRAELVDGEWHHVAIIANGSTYKIYLDGVSKTVTMGRGSNDGSWGDIANAAVFNFGRIVNDAEWLNGVLDEVKISNVERTSEEIVEEYRLGRGYEISKNISAMDLSNYSKIPIWIASDTLGNNLDLTYGGNAYVNNEPDSNTVGLWHLDEESGTGAYIKESGGSSLNGTPTGTTYSTNGKIGSARDFAAGTDRVTIANSPALNIVNNITIEAWINPDSIDSTGSWNRIVEKGENNQYSLSMSSASGYGLIARFYGTSTITTYSYVIPPLGKWSHVAVTYNGSTVKFYLNGFLVSSSANTGAISTTTGDLNIGNWVSATRGFDGKIDEVRISNIARTADEIREAYSIGMRTHTISVSFKADLQASNLITGSNDESFTISETNYGTTGHIENLNIGDSIVIKENYDGIEYSAQGTINSLNSDTGTVTVSSWNTGSTFPSVGYSIGATVFKWQKEYIDTRGVLPEYKDSITRLTFRKVGNEAVDFWIDDIVSAKYLTSATVQDETFNSARYFQYKAIFTTLDTDVSSYVSSVQIDYSEGALEGPTMDQIMRHGKWFGSYQKQNFWWAGTE